MRSIVGGPPGYDALAGAGVGALYRALTDRSESIVSATYEFTWQKDKAYVAVIDGALQDLTKGLGRGLASKPRWLDGLVQRELRAASTTFWSGERFVRVRRLERLGLIELEPDDTYVLAMISSLGTDKPAKLRSDPELVERALWRLFEVEGGGEVSLTNVDRFDGEEWRKTFLALVADGTLDRARVLEGCLSALGRDFAAYRAFWFSATYLALQPTIHETAEFQSEIRRLLSSGVPATVSFALKQLLRVHAAGLLAVEETLGALPPAALAKAKGTAISALQLARIGEPDHLPAVIHVATTALGNPNPDVQRAAADLLQKHDGTRVLTEASESLAPSVQHDLGLVVTREHAQARPMAQPLAPPPRPVPAHELAERIAALMENASDALEFEVVLAALATASGSEALAPLRKRARQVADRGAQSEPDAGRLSELLARLVLTRLGEPTSTGEPGTPALRFVVRRVEELGQTVAPLLATPDLPGGRVSPAALVERLQRNPHPRHHDLIAALLRLHPDGRAGFGAANVSPAVRYALDRTEPPKRLLRNGRPGPTSWWVAAERSWAPYGPGTAPHLQSEVRTHTWAEGGRERTLRYAHFAVQSSGRGPAADDQPTELPTSSRQHQWGDSGFGDWVSTIAAIWPLDAEHFLAIAGLSTLESGSSTEVAHDVPRVLDALARHPGHMGALAVHALAAGISATRRDYRFHAVDAFVDLVPTGRIATSDIASVLAKHAEAWPASRWTESLTAIGQAPGGSPVVLELLTVLLPQLPLGHRGLNSLLDLLRDQTIRHGAMVTDPFLLHWLGEFSGTSPVARTAAQLLR